MFLTDPNELVLTIVIKPSWTNNRFGYTTVSWNRFDFSYSWRIWVILTPYFRVPTIQYILFIIRIYWLISFFFFSFTFVDTKYLLFSCNFPLVSYFKLREDEKLLLLSLHRAILYNSNIYIRWYLIEEYIWLLVRYSQP